jgi:zinc transporter 2
METKNYYHKESIDTAASSPLHSLKVPKEKEIPKISLSKHFSNSKFQEKLKIENKVAMYKLKIISTVCFSFMIIEFICGYLAGSLAIMSDATHLLSDLAGFLISLFSLIVAMKPADRNFTFGYHRFEVLGALASILIIWGLTVWLLMAAVWRIKHPNPIVGFLMVCIAAGGLLFNIIMNRVLAYNPVVNSMDDGMGAIKKNSEEEINFDTNLDEPLIHSMESEISDNSENMDNEELKHNINADDNPVIRAAYIHILGDMIQSAGVLLAALIIYFYQDTHPGVRIVDPICTFCFAIVVLCTTVPVSRDCIYVLLESTPRDLDIESLYNELSNINGVNSVHDIHLWNISIGRPSIALHIICDNPKETLKIATQICKNYGIKHCTIQSETELYNCKHDEENDIH